MNQISIVINFIIKIYFTILKVYRLSLLPSWSLHHSCNWSCKFRLNYNFRLNCRCFKSDSIFHIIVQNVNISFFRIHLSCCIPLPFLIFRKCNITTDNHLLCHWIAQFVSPMLISNENGLLCLIIQLRSCCLGDMSISN